MLAQEIRLEADLFTPADEESIPHGEAAPVDGTPMDLREFTPIGAQIDADFAQLRFAGGYDHNWVLRGIPGVLRPAAAARCAESGITLTCETTQPGIQFYAGNFLDGSTAGKDGVRYPRRSGFCLETQAFPEPASTVRNIRRQFCTREKPIAIRQFIGSASNKKEACI